jgi:hypothetical protein
LFTGDALGIVEISLSTPSPLVIFKALGGFEGGDGQGSISREKNPFGGGGKEEEGVWSIELESQLFPLLA